MPHRLSCTSTPAGAVLHGGISFVALPTPASNVIAVLRGSDPRLAGEYIVVAAHNDHFGATRYAKDADSLRAFNLEYRRRVIAVSGRVSDSAAERIAASIHVGRPCTRRIRGLAKVSRFAFEVAGRLANVDHRIVVDKPKPAPNAKCVQ